MAQQSPTVSPADRLSFTLFLAVALHATLILGLGFAAPEPGQSAHSLDVTIAHYQTDKAPDKADFIAQANQQGSGDEDKKKDVTTTELADFQDSKMNKVQLQQPTTRSNPQPRTHRLVVTTSGLSSHRVADKQQKKTDDKPLPKSDQDNLAALSQQIASLQARLDQQKQAYAKRPRIRTITSVSARAQYEAMYVDAFRREVEAMGTRNFPQRALQQRVFGNVRLLVALKPDGDVKDIKVLASSGHPFLDRAAIQSVRMAAPFAPFTKEMRKHMDILQIIRTWKFDRRQQLTSH